MYLGDVKCQKILIRTPRLGKSKSRVLKLSPQTCPMLNALETTKARWLCLVRPPQKAAIFNESPNLDGNQQFLPVTAAASMPNWAGITQLVAKLMEDDGFDGAAACYVARSHFLKSIAEHQERDVILYASNWVWSSSNPQGDVSILPEDVVGLMAVVSGLKNSKLDLILHTPGGDPNTAEAILKYLRQKFKHIRVVIPFAAMSAGTLIACGANEIVMGRHSFIGPTDPQLMVRHPFGTSMVAAQAIIQDFNMAQRASAGQEHLGGWGPLLEQYPKGLISQCLDAMGLSKQLARDWLVRYMFSQTNEVAGPPAPSGEDGGSTEPKPPEVESVTDVDAQKKADAISEWLSDHSEHKAHGRFISRSEAMEHGLKIVALEDDNVFQDLVLSVFHTVMLQFAQKPDCSKIIENSEGNFFFSPNSRGFNN